MPWKDLRFCLRINSRFLCLFFPLCLTLWAILTPRWLLEFSAPYLSFGNWSQQSRKRVHRVESANSELLMIYDAIMERFEILLPSTPWHCYSHSCLRLFLDFVRHSSFLCLTLWAICWLWDCSVSIPYFLCNWGSWQSRNRAFSWIKEILGFCFPTSGLIFSFPVSLCQMELSS